MNLQLPPGDFRGSPETEELRTTKEFGLTPDEWGKLSVKGKEHLIACSRDDRAMQQISLMPEDKLPSLGGVLGWVRVGKAKR